MLIDRYGYEDEGAAAVRAGLLRVVGDELIVRTDRFVAMKIANSPAEASATDRGGRAHAVVDAVRRPARLPTEVDDQVDQIGGTWPFVDDCADPVVGRFQSFGLGGRPSQPRCCRGLDVVIDRMVFPSTYGIYRNDVAGISACRVIANRLHRDHSCRCGRGRRTLAERPRRLVGWRCYYQSPSLRVTVN